MFEYLTAILKALGLDAVSRKTVRIDFQFPFPSTFRLPTLNRFKGLLKSPD